MRLLLCFTSILLLASPAFADDDAPMPHAHHKSKFTLDETKTAALPECPACAACPACNAKNTDAAATSEITSTLIHLKHARADRVAAKVSAMLQREHNVSATTDGVVVNSPVIIVPNSTTNSLVVMANEQFIDETKQLIAQCDVEPKQFKVRLKMTATQGEGEDAKKIVISPTLVTVEGMPGSIVIGNGQNGMYRFDVEVVEAAGEANESTAQQTKLECSELVLLAPGEDPAECPLISQARILRLMMGAPSQCDDDACCSQQEAAAADSATADSDSCACENCKCAKCACSTGSCTDGACASCKECACSSSKECACASSKQCECASCAKCSSCPHCARAAAKQCACASSNECACASAKSKCNCSTAGSACSKCQKSECPACASKSDACPAECLAPNSAAANCFESSCETTACTAPPSANCECKQCGCEDCACEKCRCKCAACTECTEAESHSASVPSIACARVDNFEVHCQPAPLHAVEAPTLEMVFGHGGPILTLRHMLRAEQQANTEEAECEDAACESRRIQLAGHRALSSDESSTESVTSDDATSIVPAIHQVADIVSGDEPLLTKEQLIHFVRHAIEPSSWDANGGDGTIEALSAPCLVIRQTSERQAEIGKLLDHLRQISQLRKGISTNGDQIPLSYPAGPRF